MKIIHNIEEIKSFINFPTAVTLGNFDGIHLGHITLIKNVKAFSQKFSIPSVVVTYYPNPAIILGKNQDFRYLTSSYLKEELIREMGIDFLVIIPFTQEFSSITAEDFIKNILVEKLHTQYISIGFNHSFGKDRKGNIELLEKYAKEYNYHVEKLEQVFAAEEKVSSSVIRKLIHEGDMEHAARLLGRFFEIDGIVTHGHSRGKGIGYPTANIRTEEHIIIPPKGVYSGYATLQGKNYRAMINIGNKPTFGDSDFAIECHILDFTETIYTSHLRIKFVKKIREEQKFSSSKELTRQLEKDEEIVRQTVMTNSPESSH